MSYEAWSGPARVLARTVDAAVRAALADDADAFAAARVDLRRTDPDVVAVLLGSVTQDLLERVHPDGFDSDDAERVLASAGRAGTWFDEYDADLAALALVGALGLADPEQTPTVGPGLLTAHGLVLVASLLPAPDQLVGLLESALRELRRAQTVELP